MCVGYAHQGNRILTELTLEEESDAAGTVAGVQRRHLELADRDRLAQRQLHQKMRLHLESRQPQRHTQSLGITCQQVRSNMADITLNVT